MLSKAITKNAITLSLFAAFCAAMIAITYSLTKDKIANNERRAQTKLLTEILPRELYDNDLLEAQISIAAHELLGTSSIKPGYIARKGTNATAVIFNVTAADGYSGRIELLLGIAIDGKILGVRTVKHSETPGLGDKIELKKNPWILSFDGTSLNNLSKRNWMVKKEGGVFDQFTGATITPRAVVKAIYQALNYYEQHKAIIFPETFGGVREQP